MSSGLLTGYVDPLSGAKVAPERIDMGVDYRGSGPLLAIGDAIVTQVNPGWGGWGGHYIQYQLTSGVLTGQYVYYAEGVTPNVKVGQNVKAGDVIANMIPHWPTGIEMGWGSPATNSAYAAVSGGGYKENALTAAGQSFSDLVKQLGGPAGLAEGRTPTGTAPKLTAAGQAAAQGQLTPGSVIDPLAAASGAATALTGAASAGAGAATGAVGAAAGSAADAVTGAISSAFSSLFDSIVSHAKYAALLFLVIIAGFVLMAQGANRSTHATQGAQ